MQADDQSRISHVVPTKTFVQEGLYEPADFHEERIPDGTITRKAGDGASRFGLAWLTCFEFAVDAFVDKPVRAGSASATLPEQQAGAGFDNLKRMIAATAGHGDGSQLDLVLPFAPDHPTEALGLQFAVSVVSDWDGDSDGDGIQMMDLPRGR